MATYSGIHDKESEAVAFASAAYLDENGLEIRYKISPRTAQRWRTSGEGPPFVRIGRRRILDRVTDVEQWLTERTYKSRADELSRGEAA